MKYLLLVCWNVEKMDAQTEPDPTDTSDPESFPWLAQMGTIEVRPLGGN